MNDMLSVLLYDTCAVYVCQHDSHDFKTYTMYNFATYCMYTDFCQVRYTDAARRYSAGILHVDMSCSNVKEYII